MNKQKSEQVKNQVNNIVSGNIVNTIFGWQGTVIRVVERMYAFGQGVHVRRNSDNKRFSISPNDIESH